MVTTFVQAAHERAPAQNVQPQRNSTHMLVIMVDLHQLDTLCTPSLPRSFISHLHAPTLTHARNPHDPTPGCE